MMVEARRFISTIIFVVLTMACIPAGILQAAERTLLTQMQKALEEQFHDTLTALRSDYGLHPGLPV